MELKFKPRKDAFKKNIIYMEMKPFGLIKFEFIIWFNPTKAKIKFLREKGFCDRMIQGYLLAQGESESNIKSNLNRY